MLAQPPYQVEMIVFTPDPSEPGEVTRLLAAWQRGEARAADELIAKVFAELQRLATRYLGKERPDHTLEPAALVHEAYLRLVSQEERRFKNRGHFYAVAATMMRRILVDHARRRHQRKRGGRVARLSLSDITDLGDERPSELVALDDALEHLAVLAPHQATIVELRFFVGLDLSEIAATLGCSTATVTRQWLAARAWLYRELQPESPA